ncbi:MAG: CopD family protein [Chloroflexi bacterium]|nr:CopD family protein [Chloroflexota bacterium]MCY4246751.1 CopD family protein [Chloroflexota bacterium]
MVSLRWLILLGVLPLAALAQAHGYVVRAIPADRSTLERPPTRLQYWFSEALEPRFSEIHLRDQAGGIIGSGGVDQRNSALLTMPVPAGLPDGAYIVELRPAFASDGHVIAESRVFFVGEAVGGISGTAADDRAIPLEALWRAALSLANSLFFGAASLFALTLLPAWGNARYKENLPPRVMRRLRWIVAGALLLAIAANIVALVQQSMVFFNAGAAQALAQSLWQVVLIGSRFGDVWTFRMALLVFSAALLFAAAYYRELFPGLTAGIWRGLPWLGALFIGLSMITSHAAGSPLLPWLAVAVGWLHALAAAFWLGGILTLTLILPVALQPLDADARQIALRAVLSRFSRLALPLVLLALVSGVYNALNYLTAPSDLVTSYGRTLGVKLLLVAPALLLGGWHRRSLRAGSPAKSRLRLESICMLAALVAAAWLSATPLPEPAPPNADIEAPQASQTVGDYRISLAILPGGPGVNTTDVVIERAGQPVDDARVHLQMVAPARDRRSAWQLTEAVEAGLYVATGDDIDRAGQWWSLVDITDANGAVTRAAFAWDISEEAAIEVSRQPNLLHALVLLGIAGLLVNLGLSRARRLVAALQLTWASALIATGAVVLSVAVMVGGALMVAQRQREYERTLNPPPAIVNAVLPSADSVARGEALFDIRCAAWKAEPDDLAALVKRLGAARDDFLFAAVRDGWRDLPACADELAESQRWHIVNFLRTLTARD